MLLPTAATTFTFRLYDAAGALLQSSVTLDSDAVRNTTSSAIQVLFPVEQTLAANTFYYVLLEPVGTVTFPFFTVGEAAYLAQMDGGTDYVLASSSGGEITVTDTQRPMFALMLTALDDGGGGAGGSSDRINVGGGFLWRQG
jgi:hypothetical protein